MQFFTFRQNNSGGAFEVDEGRGIGLIVVIEAESDEAANERASALGMSFYGGCECCGPQWMDAYDDGEPLPMAYSAIPLWCATELSGVDKGLPSFIHYHRLPIERQAEA